jgi:hypothetical protein
MGGSDDCTEGGTDRPRRTRAVLCATDVADDDTLHPGAVVWLGTPDLQADERELFDDAAERARAGRRTAPTGRLRPA